MIDDESKGIAGGLLGLGAIISIALAALYGYVMNIITIIHICKQDDVEVTAMLILRVVGAVVGPLGAILGWFKG